MMTRASPASFAPSPGSAIRWCRLHCPWSRRAQAARCRYRRPPLRCPRPHRRSLPRPRRVSTGRQNGGPAECAATPSPLTRLLVLPFDTAEAKDLGRDGGVELADEIADSLARVEALQISGGTSADTLAAAHTGAVEAGRKLGVDAVLSGEVADRPGGLRVSARLTATKDARVMWSRVYDRQAADL